VSDVLDSVVLPQWHGAFEVGETLPCKLRILTRRAKTGNVFFQLETSDFRIPEYIVKALKAMPEGKCCNVCQTNAAFQLAVCHSIGFGIVPDNDTERDRLLESSRKELSSLEEVLDQIKVRTGTMTPEFMGDLYKRGHRETVLDRYRVSSLLLEAASKQRTIASLRNKVFGPTHYSTMRAKMNLVGILCYTQAFQEALPIALETIRNASGAAITVRDQLTAKTQLSFIYSNMSRLEEAETILRKVIEHWDERPEDRGSNQGYYYEQTLLADILLDKGDSKQALELALATEKDAVLALGPYHQASISAARVVVCALDAEGQLDSAVWLHERLLETIEKCHEADDGVVIQQLAILALQYYRLERIDDAKRCHGRIQGLVTQNVKNASPAISAVDKYARIMGNAGKHAEATMFAERLQEEVDKLLGPDDQQSAKLRGNLVTRYFQQQRYAEAEALGRRVLEYNRRVFGAKHHETLFALDTLAVTLMCRWQWAEAASLAQESFEIRDSFDDTPDKTRLTWLSMIGRGLTLSHAYEKAIGFWDRFLDLVQRDGTGNAESGPSLHLRDMVLATVCCAKLRQRPLARRRMKLVVDTIQRPWGDAPVAVVHHLTNLAKTCDENNWQVETEQALVAATLVVESAAEYLEATEPVIRRLDEAISNFFDKTGKSELVFKPEELENEMLASAMSGLAID
jgi:tetratricopeptide (TPR) repeat protein